MLHRGSLEKCSAFPFESHLGKIKSSIKSRHRVLEETINKISRIQLHSFNDSSSAAVHPVKVGKYSIKWHGFRFSSKSPDCFFRSNSGHIVRIDSIEDDFNLSCTLVDLKDYFNYPCKSSKVNIICGTPSTLTCILTVRDIFQKYVCFQWCGKNVFVPMLKYFKS